MSSRQHTTKGGSSNRAQSSSRGGAPSRQSEVRAAVDGREHEFIGLVLLGAGVLLGLAMYLDLAGPLGRWGESFLGWFVGLGRYALPIALVASGIALVK